MRETEQNSKKKLNTMMADFKVEFAGFFKGFLTNYTEEVARTSIVPLVNDIKELQTIQNDQKTQRLSLQSQ